LEAVCGPNAKDDQGRTLTQRIIHDSANWQVWERALDRVERRKTMSAEGKEKDLSFGARHRTGSDEPSNPVFYVLDLTNTPPHHHTALKPQQSALTIARPLSHPHSHSQRSGTTVAPLPPSSHRLPSHPVHPLDTPPTRPTSAPPLRSICTSSQEFKRQERPTSREVQ
jgi:hypothetical protein